MSDIKASLINLEPVCEFGVHLLDKLEKLGHFIISPKGTMPESIDLFMDDVKKSNLPEAEKFFLIANAERTIKKLSNNKAIVKSALAHLAEFQQNVPDDMTINEEQEEWYSRFFESAQHVSDSEMQTIWGRILAEEVVSPNSVPKSLIHILSIIDKQSAMVFNTLCNYFITIGKENLLICNLKNPYSFWSDKGINLSNISNLDSLGLISHQKDGYAFDYEQACDKTIDFNFPISICGKKCIILYEAYPDMPKKISLGNVTLTNSGHALFKCIKKQANNECFEFVFEYIKKQIPHIVCIQSDSD